MRPPLTAPRQAAPAPTDAEKIRGLPWLVAGGTLSSIFGSIMFGPPLTLFFDALKMSKTAIGFLLSVMPFINVFAPLSGPWTERFGLRRSYLVFFGARKLVAALLIFTPLVAARYGVRGAVAYATVVLVVFACCRAIAEVAMASWAQELVPHRMRGRLNATVSIVSNTMVLLSTAAVSLALGSSAAVGPFQWVLVGGVLFGCLGVACAYFLPGGGPGSRAASLLVHLREMWASVVGDRTFRQFLGATTLVGVPVLALLPLFLKEQAGLTNGQVVSLGLGQTLGSLAGSYPWGWAADRFGGKSVAVVGLCAQAAIPLAYLLLPRHHTSTYPLALGLYFFTGLLAMGYGLGSGRLFYGSVMPEDRRTAYASTTYTVGGMTGMLGLLFVGWLVDRLRLLGGHLGPVALNPYTPLFPLSTLLVVAGAALFARIPEAHAVGARQLAGMLFQGNPVAAFDLSLRYPLARGEPARVSMTERIGRAGSSLNVSELLEALEDPSFNVRYEALVSAAHMRPDPQVTQVLADLMRRNQQGLSGAAAWALGRIGDPEALPALREAARSAAPYVQARAARALAALGDRESLPLMLARFAEESDPSLRVTYAAALGLLGAEPALPGLLAFLREATDPWTRGELALAIGQIVGSEVRFIQLWRRMRTDAATAAAQETQRLARGLRRRLSPESEAAEFLRQSGAELTVGQTELGIALLARALRALPPGLANSAPALVLQECARGLEEAGSRRPEYLQLALHTLHAALWPEPHVTPEEELPV